MEHTFEKQQPDKGAMTSYSQWIKVRNARIHNLKHVDVQIPKGKLTVITGVSGSGKSSLAFDTLYEEGKRRYLLFSNTSFELDSVPTFDAITGLSPTVAVEQRIIRQSNPRSTVGTRSKLSAVLAILFANYGERDQEVDDGFPLSMEMFQRNSAKGMCIKCLGKGITRKVYEDEIYRDLEQRICDLLEGKMWLIPTYRNRLKDYLRAYRLSEETRLKSLTEEQFTALKYGSPRTKFPGINAFAPDIRSTLEGGAKHQSNRQRLFVYSKAYAEEGVCPRCQGTGLGEQAGHTTIDGKTITELEHMEIRELLAFMEHYVRHTGNGVAKEIVTKLACMADVGLHHLSLSRPVPTLSGGEVQRLFLASYIIAEMDSIIFVFDEPTIGLHELEKDKLISIIRSLVDRGNTVVAVEHDENFIKNADYIIDLGPDAGTGGGEKIFEGIYEDFLKCKASRTAPLLMDRSRLMAEHRLRQVSDRELVLAGADIHNLKNITCHIPLGVMVGVAGVSGSGKSSLISDTLVPKLKELMKSRCITGEGNEGILEGSRFAEETETDVVRKTGADAEEGFAESDTELLGVTHIKKCIVVDQRPIGRSKTSCPATYVGIYDRIRELFARTDTAKERGYSIGMFSVNSEGGCKVCHGEGTVRYHIGMGNFMEIPCEACGGAGFLPEVMEIELDGKNIREILELTVDEAVNFFREKDKNIWHILTVLRRVGMGYITLGQKTPTISGGESQRIKLAKELGKGKYGKDTLYILDEPTTGLSLYDSQRLMTLLQELVDAGNSVIVTEHDPYVLANCDYLIELGKGGGSEGGRIIAEGTPWELKRNASSLIGKYLG